MTDKEKEKMHVEIDRAFKQGYTKALCEENVPVSQIAGRLGVNVSTIRAWKKKLFPVAEQSWQSSGYSLGLFFLSLNGTKRYLYELDFKAYKDENLWTLFWPLDTFFWVLKNFQSRKMKIWTKKWVFGHF